MYIKVFCSGTDFKFVEFKQFLHGTRSSRFSVTHQLAASRYCWAPATVDGHVLPAGRLVENPPHAWSGCRTTGQTDTRPLHRPYFAYYAGRVILRLDWKIVLVLHTHTHPFNGPFSGTTRVSRYQTGKTNLDFAEARDSEWQWHQLGHMQVCISLQTDNHASTPPLCFYRPDALPAAQPTVSKHWRPYSCKYMNNYQMLSSFEK